MQEPATLYDIFQGYAESGKERLLLRRSGVEWKPVSAAEFSRTVRALSMALVELGLLPGDRVVLLSENRPEWAMTDYAVVCAGGLTVPLYPTLPSGQIEPLVNDCGAKIAIASTPEQLQKFESIRAGCPQLIHVIGMDGADQRPTARWTQLLERGERLNAENPDSFDRRGRAVQPPDPCTIIYTSGTTGVPKGAVLTHRNFVSNVVSGCSVLPFKEETVSFSFLPLSHVFERMLDYSYAYRKTAIAYLDDVNLLRDALPAVEPAVFGAVPRVYEKIYAAVKESVRHSPVKRMIFAFAAAQGKKRLARLAQGVENPSSPGIRLADKLVFGKLRARLGRNFQFAVSGGAPLARELNEFFWGAGIRIYEGYGLTETSPVITVNTPAHWKLGTVGLPIPGVEVRILPDGEVQTRGPHVMKGYFNKPEETAAAIDPEGWFSTGDIGEIDDEGYLRITDRKKDLIVLSGGKKAAPQPIENELKRSSLIALPIVIGNRRKFLAALIVPNFDRLGVPPGDAGRLNSDPNIRAQFQLRIDAYNAGKPHHEQIRAFAILPHDLTIESGEITPTLKVKRGAVEEKYRDLIDRIYAEKEGGGKNEERGAG